MFCKDLIKDCKNLTGYYWVSNQTWTGRIFNMWRLFRFTARYLSPQAAVTKWSSWKKWGQVTSEKKNDFLACDEWCSVMSDLSQFTKQYCEPMWQWCSIPGTIPLLDEGARLLGTEDGQCLLLGLHNGPSDPLTLLEDLQFETRQINQLKVSTIFCRRFLTSENSVLSCIYL